MKRTRIARTTDEASLRTLLQSALELSAGLEMVCKNGSRWPIALSLDGDALCFLIQATRPGSDARLELVFRNAVKRLNGDAEAKGNLFE
jgi:hypothetical protein